MLRPYRSLDLPALDALLAAFAREAPEVAQAAPRVLSALESVQVLPGKAGELGGFAFLPGDAIRFLAAFYVRDAATRQDVLAAALSPLLADGTQAVMAPERFGEAELAPALRGLGFQRIERIDMVQEVSRVPAARLALPEPYRLIDWDEARDAAAADLLAASTAGTVDGLFLRFPELPTPTACRALLAEIRGGQFGAFLPDVSAMVLDGERLVGLLIATRSGPDEVFLYELALDRSVQGRGLAPVLIRRLQAGARAHGLKGIRFMWCDINRAVRKLFPPDTIISETREPWWIWRSAAYRNRRPKPRSVPMGG